MTAQEAINVLEKPSDHIKTIHIKDKGKVVCREEIVYSADLVKALEMAIEALEKQDALERVIERLEERIMIYKNTPDNNFPCVDVSIKETERIIEIIKEELM